jgi:hypothetical protein
MKKDKVQKGAADAPNLVDLEKDEVMSWLSIQMKTDAENSFFDTKNGRNIGKKFMPNRRVKESLDVLFLQKHQSVQEKRPFLVVSWDKLFYRKPMVQWMAIGAIVLFTVTILLELQVSDSPTLAESITGNMQPTNSSKIEKVGKVKTEKLITSSVNAKKSVVKQSNGEKTISFASLQGNPIETKINSRQSFDSPGHVLFFAKNDSSIFKEVAETSVVDNSVDLREYSKPSLDLLAILTPVF